MRSKEEKVIKSARTLDQSAKYQLKRKLKKLPNYNSALQHNQDAMLSAAVEELAKKRFKAYKSSKLLQLIITYLY